MKISKQKQYDALDERYGIKERNIDTFFRSLRRYEVKISRMNFWDCERPNFKWPENYKERVAEKLAAKFERADLFRKELFISGDPRGHALKLCIPYNECPNIHRDWGGDAIIAPNDLSSEKGGAQ